MTTVQHDVRVGVIHHSFFLDFEDNFAFVSLWIDDVLLLTLFGC